MTQYITQIAHPSSLEDLNKLVEYVNTATKLAELSNNALVQAVLAPDITVKFFDQLCTNYTNLIENLNSYGRSIKAPTV